MNNVDEQYSAQSVQHKYQDLMKHFTFSSGFT